MLWGESTILAAAMRGPDMEDPAARVLKGLTTAALRWFARYAYGDVRSPQDAGSDYRGEVIDAAAALWNRPSSNHFRCHVILAFETLTYTPGADEYVSWLKGQGFDWTWT